MDSSRIIRRRKTRLELAHLRDQSREDAVTGQLRHELAHPRFAEAFIGGIHRFGHAIGDDEQFIAGSKFDDTRPIVIAFSDRARNSAWVRAIISAAPAPFPDTSPSRVTIRS